MFPILALITILSLVLGSGGAYQDSVDARWRSKVDPPVLTTAAGGETEFLITLNEQADLGEASKLKTKLEKGHYVYQQLTAVAARTQGPILAELAAWGVDHRPYWIANMIWVRGDLPVLTAMASRDDVAHIYANPKVRLDEPTRDPLTLGPQSTDTIEWNISKVHAPEVWAAGYTGQGITIGGQDTGYAWEHPALKDQYRGWNGASADHNYNWHDAIQQSDGNPCGENSPEPCDDHGHGTHTMGIMVGDDPGHTNQVGMAPGAKWIGCRNMDRGRGSPLTYSECYQWFLAPTDLNDMNPDPSKAPDVISNSWSCPPSEGCHDPMILKQVVEALRAAGILTVHSAGNGGSTCSSVNTPGAIYDASFTVGNTTFDDQISLSSSRGPVTIDSSGRLKPDVSAPGTSIRSSYPGGGYLEFSGTSMASPHVAGLAALLFSAQPALIGDVDQVESLIARTAVPLTSLQECGGIPGTDIPNNTSGWGRIDALNALQAFQVYLPWIVGE
jgi:subtilisin family serine protease